MVLRSSASNGFEALMHDHRHENVRISDIMPGSPAGDKSWMIAPEEVAEAVTMVLSMPSRTMVSRIEMRPLPPANLRKIN